jgi:hypothetical protein
MTIKDHLEQDISEIETILAKHLDIIAQLDRGAEQPRQDISPLQWTKQHPLRQIVLETIEELEISRQAFKSKQLEALRKKLIRALAESA